MKPIRINKEVIERIERLAREGGIAGIQMSTTLATNTLLGIALNHLDEWKHTPLKNIESDKSSSYSEQRTEKVEALRPVADETIKLIKRKPHVIHADILAAEKKLAEELEFNQDPDSRRMIENDSKVNIKALWDEYHESKDAQV